MSIELRELTLNDGPEILDMLKEIGTGENGFQGEILHIEKEDWPQYLKRKVDESKGINLKPEHVSQNLYWLIINGKPVGMSKFRHSLTEKLKITGGHIGYTIRPAERGKGYGNLVLQETLKKAKAKGLKEVLITCNEDNVPSRKIIESHGGKLQDINETKCRYWITL